MSTGFIHLEHREGNGRSENWENSRGCALKTKTVLQRRKLRGAGDHILGQEQGEPNLETLSLGLCHCLREKKALLVKLEA